MTCGYTWEDPNYESDYSDDCGGEHECILATAFDGHTEHECACGESQAEEE
jgi:hypothetical protein